MKKIILSLISIFALCSCSDHDIEQMSMDTAIDGYNNSFIEYVGGSISPTQDWGFNTDFSVAATRGVDPNSNEWASKGYKVPGPITTDERNAVLAVFNKKGKETYTSLVNWDCFFVQQVWKGTASYTAGNGGTVVGGNQMDWLCAGSPTMGDDHVNNFNNADGSIMLMVNSSTQRFGYKSSTDNGHVFYYFRMEEINGNYYVGFDFSAEGQNPNEQVQRDLIYNDWIVKIVPGKGVTKTYDVRVIAEDLSVNDDTDFDFNDVVFDVAIDKVNKETWICLRAAGGTLPLTVGGLEVHNLFGVSTDTMVNTGWGGATIDWNRGVEVKLNAYYENAKDIPIIVLKGNYAIPLYALVGGPASKIGVPVTFHWCKERESIKGVYPSFTDWVMNNNITAWW
jgi:hypothetical protein